jgi:hypothetical protein
MQYRRRKQAPKMVDIIIKSERKDKYDDKDKILDDDNEILVNPFCRINWQ